MYQWLSKRYPIWRDAEALALNIEEAVSRFPRYHKYAIGMELRTLAGNVLSGVTHCLNQKQARLSWVKRLQALIEELKLKVQLAKRLGAFRSFAQFQYIAELCVAVAKQSASWIKQLQRRSQNP